MAADPLDVATARWLTGEGLAVVRDVADRFTAGASPLVVGTELRAAGLDVGFAAAASAAAEARFHAATQGWRVPELLTTSLALQQGSHPVVADWRARRFADDRVADLCAGTGGDAWALTEVAAAVVAVERDEARGLLLNHNLAGRAAAVCGDALAPPVASSVLVHADPSRRTARGRARHLGEYTPDVRSLLEATARFPGRGITVSPAVALDDPHLPTDHELEFIEVDGRLVEAVIWTGALRRSGTVAQATLLPDGLTWTRQAGPRERVAVGGIGTVLIEPTAALVRARAHDDLAMRIGANRIARSRSLLTIDDDPGPSPWYRRHRVEAVLPAQARAVRAWLRTAPEAPLEIAVSGLDADPRRWWDELGRPERGPRGRRLLLVRLDEGAAAISTRAL